MPTPPLIVIGTSAGGVSALSTLLGGLPNDLNAPICIARHANPTRASLLPQILSRVGTLTVAPFQSGAQLLPGYLFVAPAGHHLLIEHTEVKVFQEQPKRPRDDIDRLFQSAAASYGSRLIAVILTGMLTDGTAGLQTVKQQGGTTIIQDPEEAAFPSMPQSAQAQCAIDYCLPLAHIAQLLSRLLGDMASPRSQMESGLQGNKLDDQHTPLRVGESTNPRNKEQWDRLHEQTALLRERLRLAWKTTVELIDQRYQIAQDHQDLRLQQQAAYLRDIPPF